MVFLAPGRLSDAVHVRGPVGRQLLRTQLDSVRAQQVPSRVAVRELAAGVTTPVYRPSETGVHSVGEKREYLPATRRNLDKSKSEGNATFSTCREVFVRFINGSGKTILFRLEEFFF